MNGLTHLVIREGMKEEYTAETYPSFGKTFNNEPAVISLTSWKKRIGACSKTIFSLLRNCPGFHIVLVLSEEEFPRMLDELPEDIKLLVENNLIELMFVYYNYRSFKKILFTMNKYRDVPIISADDDCIYRYNYAEELYQKCIKYKCMVTETTEGINGKNAFGYATIYPPAFIIINEQIILAINKILLRSSHDDYFMRFIRERKNIKLISLHKPIHKVALFSNYIEPLARTRFYNEGDYIKRIIDECLR